jgi:hypothetical protein
MRCRLASHPLSSPMMKPMVPMLLMMLPYLALPALREMMMTMRISTLAALQALRTRMQTRPARLLSTDMQSHPDDMLSSLLISTMTLMQQTWRLKTMPRQRSTLNPNSCAGITILVICLLPTFSSWIPERLATCRFPRCPYGRAAKKIWRTKGQTNRIRTVTKPGQCVSVDQLESPVPGFKGQNKGSFYQELYKMETIFVDHFSRLSFVYLQESTKGAETLLAKRAFETYASSFGVAVTNYHTNNGRFAEAHGQTISLCGVNVHIQNGTAETPIHDLTKRARTSLLQAMHRWPSAVTINIWPYYALQFTNYNHNAAPSIKTGQTPLESFSRTPVRPQQRTSGRRQAPKQMGSQIPDRNQLGLVPTRQARSAALMLTRRFHTRQSLKSYVASTNRPKRSVFHPKYSSLQYLASFCARPAKRYLFVRIST